MSGLLDISEDKGKSGEVLSLDDVTLEDHLRTGDGQDLRTNLAGLYSARAAGVTADDIILTAGPSAAAFTLLSSILVAGDHVICQSPANNSFIQISRILGAEVTYWKSTFANKWRLQLNDVQKDIKDNTKAIILQSPCDPTGAIVPRPVLEELVDLVTEKGIMIIADETFRPLFHSILPSNQDFSPSTINLGYKKVAVVGSITKAYSLPGVNIGWIASRDQSIIDACNQKKPFITPSISKLDETVAAEAVSDRCIHALLARNIRLCQANLDLLEAFISEHSWACSWVKPLAGTTALLKFHKMGKPIDSEALCDALLSHSGLLIGPAAIYHGEAVDLRGYVSVAFGGPTTQFEAALAAWTLFMEERYDTVPVMTKRPDVQGQ